ncbi:hypothetical protein L6452_04980 [Arctium lappa]|uniref:Uncharacterized protein n=1 Tax=Arctium lappa TaxID=4217 RepID=A0ACB9EFR3_ARCLA|nr:hypothetical protein L6452_04980 [Arctium lappa]
MFPSFAPATNTPLSHDPTGNPNSSLFFLNPLPTNDIDDATNQFYFEDILLDNNYHLLIDQPSYQGSTPLVFAPHFSISEQNPVLQEMATASTGAYQDSSRLDEQNSVFQDTVAADDCMRETVINVESKIAFRMKTKLEVVDDGYKWRKYGKKKVKKSPHPRNYYHCAAIGCKVKKRIERDIDDPSYVIVTYDAVHNHKRSS